MGWRMLRDLWVTNMLHLGYWGWGQLSSSSITSFFRTWRWKNGPVGWSTPLSTPNTPPPGNKSRPEYLGRKPGSGGTPPWMGGGGRGFPAPSLDHAILGLVVHWKVPRGQFRLTPQTSNPLPHPIPIRWPRPGHSECVILHRHAVRGVARLDFPCYPPYCCNHICRWNFDHPQALYFHPFHLNFSRRWNYVRLWVPNFISTWFVQPQLHSMHPWIINHRSIFLPFFYRISVGGGEKKSP